LFVSSLMKRLARAAAFVRYIDTKTGAFSG